MALAVVSFACASTAAVLLVTSDLLPSVMALHGAMMIVAWGCILPLGGVVARYFKVVPGQDFPAVVDNPFWWRWHRILQYSGVAVASVALALMLRETGGRFDTLHGRCGLVLMILAWAQVASPLFRGSKGGPTEADAMADDPGAWRGDHFDMTARRRLFEAWHKPVGWALIGLAQATLVLGAALAGGPAWLFGLIGATAVATVLAVCDSHLRGRWVDTHEALWGPDPVRRARRDDAPRCPVTPGSTGTGQAGQHSGS